MGGWWRWALVSPDGVAPSRMVGVSASDNIPLHHEVQKFSSGTGSPGWSRKKGRKTVVVCGFKDYLTQVSRCQKSASSGLYGAREDIRGRHTDSPAGRHSIQTNQRSTSIVPPFLRRIPFLPQPSHFILTWDRHQICWLAYRVAWFLFEQAEEEN